MFAESDRNQTKSFAPQKLSNEMYPGQDFEPQD